MLGILDLLIEALNVWSNIATISITIGGWSYAVHLGEFLLYVWWVYYLAMWVGNSLAGIFLAPKILLASVMTVAWRQLKQGGGDDYQVVSVGGE